MFWLFSVPAIGDGTTAMTWTVSVTPANPIDPNTGDDDNTTYLRSWDIQPDTPEVGVISIRVQVRWTDEIGVPRDFLLDGMRADL